MLHVVLDTNVLVSALIKANSLPSLILSLVLNNQIEICLSDDVLNEYQGVLARKKFQSLDQKLVKALLQKLEQNCIKVSPKQKVVLLKDQDDNKFLECAEESEADFIITGNSRHFPKKHKSTQILSPKEFIMYLVLNEK